MSFPTKKNSQLIDIMIKMSKTYLMSNNYKAG